MTSERALPTALRQRSPIGRVGPSGTASIAIGQTVLNGDADQIGGARGSQLGFDLAAVVRSGLVADAECVGYLDEVAALRQQTQDFEIARGEVFEGVGRGSHVRENKLFGNLVFDIGATAGDASDCFEELFRRNSLADI